MPKPVQSSFEPPAAPDAVASVVTEIATRGRQAYDAWLDTVSRESQAFVDGLSHDSAEVLARLQSCRTPLEVLGAQQAFLMARAKAQFDCGLRLFESAVLHGETGLAEGPGFRLPE